MSSSSPSVKVVLGAMDFGRFATESASLSMVESFLAAGHVEVDTALAYAGGESESIIGRFPADVKRRIVLHTKVNPTISVKGQTGLTRENVLNQCNESLTSLQLTPSPASPPLDILYLHRPDHKTEVLDTLRGMQELFVQGKYRRLGLSNYSAWQVMDVYHICEEHNFVKPTVYQGMYNAVTRAVEPELFPCLRHLGISFYAYNPLAGGLLTGKYAFDEKPTEDGRFTQVQKNDGADMYLQRYWKKPFFTAIDRVKAALKAAYGEGEGAVTLTNATLRWLMHHSQLKGECGDAVILGASQLTHVTQNLKGITGGPLDAAVVKAFDDAWQLCKGDTVAYFR